MDKAGELILALLHSATNAHIHHWQTDSYSQHKVLAKYYDGIPDLVDGVVEALMGRTGERLVFPADYMKPAEDPLQELLEISDFFEENRYTAFGNNSEIQNLADGIQELIDSTIYKLRFLK